MFEVGQRIFHHGYQLHGTFKGYAEKWIVPNQSSPAVLHYLAHVQWDGKRYEVCVRPEDLQSC